MSCASDLHLPVLGQHLWNAASPLRVAIDCHSPRRSLKSHPDWTSSLLPWDHTLCGGISVTYGQLHLVSQNTNVKTTRGHFHGFHGASFLRLFQQQLVGGPNRPLTRPRGHQRLNWLWTMFGTTAVCYLTLE
jgi:hypothetical protein